MIAAFLLIAIPFATITFLMLIFEIENKWGKKDE
jgi:hypothetical protein